jgi:microcystin-dependent protein
MTLYKWSQTAAADAAADSTINWAEGQAPSSINDSARAMMAAIAKWRDDTGGNLQTGGTSTAYTLTTNQVFDSVAHMNGAELTFIAGATNGPSPTLNVDGLGAYPIMVDGANAVPTGTMIAGSVYQAVFYSSVNQWRLKNFYVLPYVMPIGAVMEYYGSTVPNAAFVFPTGQAISRSTYATLFGIFGTTYGVGDGSTTFNVPDLTGRVTAMKEASASRLTSTYFGGNSTTLGAVGGLESHTLTTAQLASHSHANSLSDPGHAHSAAVTAVANDASYGGGVGGGGNFGHSIAIGVSVSAALTGITINNAAAGSGNAHNNVQPTIVLNKILRII